MNAIYAATVQTAQDKIISLINSMKAIDLLNWTNDATFLLAVQKDKLTSEQHRNGMLFIYAIVEYWIVRRLETPDLTRERRYAGDIIASPFDCLEGKVGLAAIIIANANQMVEHEIENKEVDAFQGIARTLAYILSEIEIIERCYKYGEKEAA